MLTLLFASSTYFVLVSVKMTISYANSDIILQKLLWIWRGTSYKFGEAIKSTIIPRHSDMPAENIKQQYKL